MVPVLQSREQRRLVDDRPARGVHQDGALLHLGKVGRAQKAAGAVGQHEMDADKVRRLQKLVLADERRAALGRLLLGEVLAPRHDVHAEGLGVARDAAAQASEPDDAQPLALEDDHLLDAVVPATRAHQALALGEVAGAHHQQGPAQLGGRGIGAAARRVADRDAAVGRGLVVQAGRPRAGQDHEFQVGQLLDQRPREGRALAQQTRACRRAPASWRHPRPRRMPRETP